MIQSGHISEDMECSLEDIKEMLYQRFDAIDYVQAKEDVEPFIRDISILNIWQADFFKQITRGVNGNCHTAHNASYLADSSRQSAKSWRKKSFPMGLVDGSGRYR